MSVSSATGSYGFPRQPQHPLQQPRGRPGQPQPISIPMSGSGSGGAQYPYAMPLHLLQRHGANSHYASAPTSSDSPYLQATYYQQQQQQQQQQPQAQFKQPRLATAIPPHLCNVSSIGGGSSLSPLGSPQLAYMYGSLPTDLGSSLGSYTSMQSDATDLASPGSMHGAAGGNPMNMVNLPSSLYDVQIPGSPGAQQQAAAMAFAGAKGSGGGMSPAPSPLTPATAGFGLPTQFPVPSKSGTDGLSGEAMSGATGRARTYTAETSHRRTLTDESADSISNVPLLERSTFGGSSYDIEGGYPPNSAMSVDFNPQQHEHHYSLPSDIGTLLPGAGSGDGGSVLECSSQAYIDLISSYGLNQDPATVANYSMLLDSKLGSWESQHHPQQQQPQPQQQQPSSSLMDGIAPELTVYPPPQPQHQQQQPP